IRLRTLSSSSTTRSLAPAGPSLISGRRALLAQRHLLDLDALPRLVVLDGRGADLVGDLDSRHDLAEDGVLALEARLVAQADEELRAPRVPARGQSRRPHGPAHEGALGELGLQEAQPALAVTRRFSGVLGVGVAALDDPAADDAVEDRPVVVARLGGLLED